MIVDSVEQYNKIIQLINITMRKVKIIPQVKKIYKRRKITKLLEVKGQNNAIKVGRLFKVITQDRSILLKFEQETVQESH